MSVTQIQGHEQIKPNTITDAEVNNTIIVAAGTNAFTADQSLGSHKLTNVTDPTNPQDAATKAYVDARAAGLDPKASCRAVQAAALASYTYSTLVLTASANGALGAVDGVTLALNDRVLINGETAGNAKYNGIYTLTQLGDGSNPWKLTRASDFDATAKVTAGAYTFVTEGTTYADTGWVLSTNDPITLDTTALAFVQFTGAATITAGAGLTKTGSTIDFVAGDASLTVNADEVHIAYSGTPTTQAIGDSATAGTDVHPAHVDHKHGMPAAGTPGASAPGDTAATGSGGNVAYSDHKHGRETFVMNETCTGTINSSNTAFTIAHTPTAAGIMLFLNGILLQPGAGNDYTISGANITMLFAPTTGDKLIAGFYAY